MSCNDEIEDFVIDISYPTSKIFDIKHILGFRGGVMPCCKHIIADYVPHIPWIEDLLGTFLGFCPIVAQNPTLVHMVSVLP
jgi:hypothetical protein